MAEKRPGSAKNDVRNSNVIGGDCGHDEGPGWSQKLGRGGATHVGGRPFQRKVVGIEKGPKSGSGSGNLVNKTASLTMITAGLTAELGLGR